MKATVFPEVTTRRCVCDDHSIEVIELGKVSVVERVLVRKSHHLIRRSNAKNGISVTIDILFNLDALDFAIFACRHPNVVTNPDHAFYGPVMREGTRIAKEIRFYIWSIEIEDPYFLLLTTSEKMRCFWR